MKNWKHVATTGIIGLGLIGCGEPSQSRVPTSQTPAPSVSTPSGTTSPASSPAVSSSASRILSFYSGTGRDQSGRTINDIRRFTFRELEDNHDYIQWLFPLRTPSGPNPHAPTLTDEDIVAFQESEVLREELRRSFVLILGFFGFEFQPGDESTPPLIVEASWGASNQNNWLTHTHNFQRITRILICLRTLGLEPEAQAFFTALQPIYHRNTQVIGRAYGFWQRAMRN